MDNRISQLTVQPTVTRSTVDEPFGQVLARTVGTAANVVGNTVGGGIPILSAALSTASRMSQAAGTSGPSGNTFSSSISSITGAGGGNGAPDSMALLQAQQALQEQGQSFNMQYLALQDQMQKESQGYQAISNIMKVRSDSAKAAINNIR